MNKKFFGRKKKAVSRLLVMLLAAVMLCATLMPGTAVYAAGENIDVADAADETDTSTGTLDTPDGTSPETSSNITDQTDTTSSVPETTEDVTDTSGTSSDTTSVQTGDTEAQTQTDDIDTGITVTETGTETPVIIVTDIETNETLDADPQPRATYNITLNPNTSRGGSGQSARIITDRNGYFTFPDPADVGITPQAGYVFAGWHEDSGVPENVLNYTYQPGVQIQTTRNSPTTYYATWINTNSTGSTDADFFIRLDGIMPYEPNSYSTGYTYGVEIEGALRSPVGVNNNLDGVYANLARMPSDQQIAADLRRAGVSFDPETQEIVWYVIKYQYNTYGLNAGEYRWHVDGVIRDKENYWVIYHPNGGSTDGIPAAQQYAAGVTVEVEYTNGRNEPTREGYTFLGWDEDPNAAYPEYAVADRPESFTMPAENVNLYAIWMPDNNTQYRIEYYLEQEDGTYELNSAATEIKFGTTDTTATVTDDDIKQFEGWEYDADNENNVKSGTITASPTLVLKLYYNIAKPTTVPVKLDKIVTGNLGDWDKKFTFEVLADWELVGTYQLSHNDDPITIQVPAGALIRIEESGNEGYIVSAKVDGESATMLSGAIMFDADGNSHEVVFTNNQNAIIDTGIILDSAPYAITLTAASAGAVVMAARRKKHGDDD